jgi:hypothetical protein
LPLTSATTAFFSSRLRLKVYPPEVSKRDSTISYESHPFNSGPGSRNCP